MNLITNKNFCTGCQVCRLICPNSAINITMNNEGFLVPHIDSKRCTDCGQCAKKCPQNNRPKFKNNELLSVWGARYKNDTLLNKSTSGGAFVAMAKLILEHSNGAVFGCAFDDNIVAKHMCVTDFNNIEPLQSSKYVQSDVGDTFTQSKVLLESGQIVLYSGTPCQIAGLYAFLGRDYDNLYTVDIVCHGVPSPLLFKRYIDWLGKKYNGKIIYFDFRSKDKIGWGMGYKTKTKTKTKTKYPAPSTDPYYSAFLKNGSLRECCYFCKYANIQRVGDITLADFWGIDITHPEFNDVRGVSAVMINSAKGNSLFHKISAEFVVFETTIDKVMFGQPMLKQAASRPASRDTLYRDVNNDNIDIFCKNEFHIGIKTHVKEIIKLFIPIFMFRKIRVLITRKKVANNSNSYWKQGK